MNNEKTNKEFMSLFNDFVLMQGCVCMFITQFIKRTWVIHEPISPYLLRCKGFAVKSARSKSEKCR